MGVRDAREAVVRLQDALDGQVDCRIETVKRVMRERDELLAMLKRMATPEVSRCEVNRSMVDVDRECGEMNRCEPCRAALEAEALIARIEGER